jgi:hypothetical protein
MRKIGKAMLMGMVSVAAILFTIGMLLLPTGYFLTEWHEPTGQILAGLWFFSWLSIIFGVSYLAEDRV